jgi:hypothetical protein
VIRSAHPVRRVPVRHTLVGAAALAGMLGVVGGVAPPAHADTSIGVFETSIAVETLQGGGSAVNRVLVASPVPGSVLITFDDVVPADDLSWERVDFGTTPYSLVFRLQAEPSVLRYEGDMVGTRHVFDVTLRADGLDDQPRAGFITYAFVPDSVRDGDQGLGVRMNVAARVRVGAWPADLEVLPARIAVSDLRLERDRTSVTGVIDRLIPDLPRVINRGPATVRARTTNVGDVLVRADTTLTLTRLPWSAALPFVDPPGFTVMTYNDRTRLLLPGEVWASAVPSTASLDTGQVDRLPVLGLVRIGVESSARLGASRSDASASATYLVAPWKETLVLALLVLTIRTVRRRSRSVSRAAERS